MVDCVSCAEKPCSKGKPCPVGKPMGESALREYRKGKNLKLYRASSSLEAEGYMRYTRVEELIQLARKLGWKKLGIAFCIGLSEETKKLQELLKSRRFEVHSVVCKVGGFEKEQFSIPTMGKGDHACNPVLQAMVLNQAKTELNIILGLCLGHDVLFQVYSKAPTTTLIVKDRVLAHNPAGALYSRYHFRRLKGK
ncbi:MAG TPA: DUF1847 domain-containing protein [Hadesarchaea archaeon]|nr:DUF1847 domain-containing protein [Hadesarchaea archaeon]